MVSGRRITRTRPLFRDFGLELPVEVDPVIFDLDTIKMLWTEAGKYIGLGDVRTLLWARRNGIAVCERCTPPTPARRSACPCP